MMREVEITIVGSAMRQTVVMSTPILRSALADVMIVMYLPVGEGLDGQGRVRKSCRQKLVLFSVKATRSLGSPANASRRCPPIAATSDRCRDTRRQ